MHSQPTLRRSPSLLNALRMRCPLCGYKPISEKFGELVDTCPGCGYSYTQGEEGYWTGALIVNLAVAMAAFFVTFVGTMLVTWPEVPWTLLLVLCLGVMALLPIVFYPRSKTVWVWLDLRIHPYQAGER